MLIDYMVAFSSGTYQGYFSFKSNDSNRDMLVIITNGFNKKLSVSLYSVPMLSPNGLQISYGIVSNNSQLSTISMNSYANSTLINL